MAEFNYVIRDNGMPELICAESEYDFLELDKILEDNYPYIADSMNEENYHVEVGISAFFDEILYDDKVVGFATFDAGEDFELILQDCFILPEFRGKRLFFNELEKLIFLGSNLTILQPTRKLVQLLLDYAYAKNVTEDIVVSAIDFIFDDVDVKTNKRNELFSEDLEVSNFYDLSICSTIFYKNDEVYYHNLLDNDLKDYGERKILDDDYFNNIKELFLNNKDKFDQLVLELKEELPNVEFGYNEIIGQGHDLSDYMWALVNDGLVSYEEALDIKEQLKSEYEAGQFEDDIELNKRLFDLVDNDFPIHLDFEDIKEIINSTDNESFEFKLIKQFFEVIGNNKELADELLNSIVSGCSEEEFHSMIINAMGDDEKFMDDMLDMAEDFDDDLLSIDFSVDYTQQEDRELFFEEILNNVDAKFRLIDEDYEYKYPIDYKLDMFNVLKSFKQCNNFISAIIHQHFSNLDYDDFIENLLLEKGYIDDSVDYENWDEFADDELTVKNIKDFLRENNLKVSGNKKALVDRVRQNNLPLDKFTTYKYRLSDKGDKFIKNNFWIDFYNIFLVPFDFGDFCRYFENHDGDVKSIAKGYVDCFIKQASQNNDNYLAAICFDIQKMMYRYADILFTPQDIFE